MKLDKWKFYVLIINESIKHWAFENCNVYITIFREILTQIPVLSFLLKICKISDYGEYISENHLAYLQSFDELAKWYVHVEFKSIRRKECDERDAVK